MKYVPPLGGAPGDPYVDANPGIGLEGSTVPAAAIERPQREIVKVLTDAGLVPNDADLTQLSAAIQKLVNAGAPYVLIQDQKPSGTNGGTFTSGAWRTRDLNTKVVDTAGIATLASNQITLPTGIYRVRASAPAGQGDSHKARLYNITDAALLLLGTTENASTSTSGDFVQTRSQVAGQFALAAAKVIELQHQIITTAPSIGFGQYDGFDTEVYSQIEIWKVA